MEISASQVIVSHLPTIRRALLIGRGGAAVWAASTATEAIASKLSSGASAVVVTKRPETAVSAVASIAEKQDSSPLSSPEHILGWPISPEGKSVLYMAAAMACHYLGYSLARPVTVALFTSASTGYAGFAAAFPFAMAFVSPASLLLLLGYGNILERLGPRGALTQSTLFCALFLSLAAAAIAVLSQMGLLIGGIPAVKFITGPLFIFRESYVQLLTSQYWSFMASVLTPSQSAKWFGPLAGLTSIASALAGVAVSPLVDRIGLSGALFGTGITLLLSLFGARAAYQVADQYGFTPTDVKKKKIPVVKKGSLGKGGPAPSAEVKHLSLFQKATHLFARVPVLWALFLEILASQGLSTVLNVCFVARLGTAIPNDSERAGWVGIFFSLINVITMVLQFAILPPLMVLLEPRVMWRSIPLVILAFTCFQAFQKDPTLNAVSASLLVMKVSEYSARRMLDEMVFVPLDFESRFLGKEVIGVFGYRFGKSLMSLALSALTSLAGDFGLQQLSILSSGVSLLWLGTAWRLSNLVPTRAEAEEAYKKEKEKKS